MNEGAEIGGYIYQKFPESVSEIISTPTSSNNFKDCNKWLRSLSRTQLRELEIPVPQELLKLMESSNSANANNSNNTNNSNNDESIAATVEVYQNIFLTIDYSIDLSKLNFGSISMYKARPNPKNQIRYVQLIGNALDRMGRYLMPCADLPGERLANWDLEYSVICGEWQDVFDRIHLISSGVLCRQVKRKSDYM